MPETTGMTKFFVWMEIGRVPMIITFCFFLMVFSLAGFGVQSVASTLLLGNQLPWFLASPAVFVAVLPVVKFGNRALHEFGLAMKRPLSLAKLSLAALPQSCLVQPRTIRLLKPSW